MTSELLDKQRWRLIRRLIGVVIVTTLAITLVVLYKHENEKKFMQLAPEVVAHNSTFAIKLYTQLQDQPGNLIFSPYSISTVLAILYAGARTDTADQMAHVLNFPQTPQEQEHFHWVLGQLQQRIEKNQPSDHVVLNTANALWIEKTSHFLEPFLELIKRNYLAELHQIDFDAVAKVVNTWVANKTKGKINNIMSSEPISDLSRLILVNAIYFKGKWIYPFETERTQTRRFWLNQDSYTQVSMMELEETLYYVENDTVQILELPYGKSVPRFFYSRSVKREEFSMIILLPKQRNGLAQLEHALNAKQVEQWLSQMNQPQKVHVWLPQFKMKTRLDLDTILKLMGMPNAFNSEQADFSGLSETPKFISQWIHQAIVEVNEEGTEVAAATAADLASAEIEKIYLFHADHPFIFLIRHNPSQSILFLGRLTAPNSSLRMR